MWNSRKSALAAFAFAVAMFGTSTNAMAQTVAGKEVPGALEIEVTEFNLPTKNSKPEDVFVAIRDGSVWYSAPGANLIGRMDPKTRKFEEFHLRPRSDPNSFVEHSGSGVQSTVFFTSHTGAFIGEYDQKTRAVREFRIEGSKLLLNDLTFDPNGVVWFTVGKAQPPQFPRGSKVGSLNLFSSEIKLADVAARNANPYSIAVNSKGTPFFTELGAPTISSIHPVTMKVTEHPLPNRESGVNSLTITSDDIVWYTDSARGYLGRFDPSTGKFEEWQSPSGTKSHPTAIANMGNIIWFAESGTRPQMLVRFDPSSEKFQSWAISGSGAVNHLYAHSDGSIWFTRPDANQLVRVTIKNEQH